MCVWPPCGVSGGSAVVCVCVRARAPELCRGAGAMRAGSWGCGAGTPGPTAGGAGVWGALLSIHHSERSARGGYHRVSGGSPSRSYPLISAEPSPPARAP